MIGSVYTLFVGNCIQPITRQKRQDRNGKDIRFGEKECLTDKKIYALQVLYMRCYSTDQQPQHDYCAKQGTILG